MSQWPVKQKSIVATLIVAITSWGFYQITLSDWCQTNGICMELYWSDYLGSIMYSAIGFVIAVLPITLLTFFLKPAVFETWKKFAVWGVPTLLALTWYLMRDTGGGGFFSIDFSFEFLLLFYIIFFLVSLIIIFTALIRKPKVPVLLERKTFLSRLTPKRLFYITLISSAFIILINSLADQTSCPAGASCQPDENLLNYIGVIFLAPIGLLPLTLLLYTLHIKASTFDAWKRFAVWALPMTLVLISSLSNGTGYVNQNSEVTALFFIIYAIFITASLSIIFIKER